MKTTRREFMKVVPAGVAMASARCGGRRAARTSEGPWTLWYAKPAGRWLEALPVGNGRLGAMMFGGVERDRLALNEATVWSGEPGDDHENPGALAHLHEIRELLFAGRYMEARELCGQHMLGRQLNYGTHLPMADLFLDWRHGTGEAGEYRRLLDLDDGVARVEYSAGGARFTRELLASNPDQVMVLRVTCDKPGGAGFAMSLSGGDLPSEVRAEGRDMLVLTGRAWEEKHSDGKSGVEFQTSVRVVNEGGEVSVQGDRLEVEQADAVTLLIAANTNFGGGDPAPLCEAQLAAAAKPYEELRQAHAADHGRLFHRVGIDLGGAELAGQPTDERLAAVRAGGDDRHLLALFFQYGRYLLIAGSRPDSPLPTNLQGIWNDNLACRMGWTCDFHLDINTQQNYWPAEACNLTECNEPLFRLIESLTGPGRRTARKMYGADGWVCHVFTNAWGFTAPGWGLGWGLHPTGGIWIASHLWEHYLFTGDKAFLEKRAYPVLKEAAEFFLDYMVEHPKHGYLVTGPAVSPENSFLTPDGGRCAESMGPTCDSVLVRDLYDSCIKASSILGVDAGLRGKIEAARAKLPPLMIRKHGQLQEWLEDYEEAVPAHRHTSHLIALCPSNQITPRGTPEMAEAARVTIERRLSQEDWEDVEWSRANLINFFARLEDSEKAHEHLLGLLREDTDDDLLTFSRGGIAGARQNIFVVDGNSAGAAGLAEMLLQSHTGEIHLLPALPKAWPEGSIRGLRARGGVEVDIEWRNGKLFSATLRGDAVAKCQVRYGSTVVSVDLKPGEERRVDQDLDLVDA